MNKAQRAKLFDLADSILAVSRHVNAVKDAEAEPGTPLEGAVMRFIDRNPGTSAGEAAEATALISSNFSRALRGLESRGLVRREIHELDARRVRLYPTEKAATNLETLRDLWSELLYGTVDDPEQLDAMIVQLRQIESRVLSRVRPK